MSGGIGLFLLGMNLMTDSLKEIAGEQLRLWLARFTGSAWSGMLSGIGFTLAVQSSTATTLATIGFVSAGILSFTQAIGIVIGANIGTTSTGWMVAFLGVKFSITHIALPLIAIGAILKLLTHGRSALVGLTLAGFGLLFYGIDLLQVAMSGFAAQVDLSPFAGTSLWTQLGLVLVGIIMTILLQSSSAAVTATLAALASGAIDLGQALNLVIGQNIGTVATAVLAAIGANISAQRTAAVHVIFNVMSALLAFILLKPVFLWLFTHTALSKWDHVVIVAAFHTAFSVLGALFVLPNLRRFEALITRLLPERHSSILTVLDQASLSVPSLAIQAANQVMRHILLSLYRFLQNILHQAQAPSQHQLQQLDQQIAALQRYLADIPISEDAPERRKLTNLLRMMVYIDVLRGDVDQQQYQVLLAHETDLSTLRLDYEHLVQRQIQYLKQETDSIVDIERDLFHLKQWTDENRSQIREHLMQYASQANMTVAKSFDLLAAQRWLDRTIAHSQRLAKVLAEHQEPPVVQDVGKNSK